MNCRSPFCRILPFLLMVCAESQYMDLAVGADLGVGYLELKDFNHAFRILETAALRIKDPNAIVVFE